MKPKKPWIVQIQFHDKSVATCPMHLFRRKLAGTGIEVDRSYEPVRVAAGRFVGRGFATQRAVDRCNSGRNLWVRLPPRVLPLDGVDVQAFEEIKVARTDPQIGVNP